MAGDGKHVMLSHAFVVWALLLTDYQARHSIVDCIGSPQTWHTKGAQWHCMLWALAGGTRTRRGRAQAASGPHAFTCMSARAAAATATIGQMVYNAEHRI